MRGRELYALPEFYVIIYQAFRTFRDMSREKKKGELSDKLIERIMLAVTEVNRCPLCSYEHTKLALEAGLSDGEIKSLLSRGMEGVPEDETDAVLFAQHYADSRAKPSVEAWRWIVSEYGEEKAKGILGAVRAITFGNAAGIVLSSLKGRFRGEADSRSTIFYELSMLMAFVLFPPFAFFHALISNLFGRPLI